MAIFYQEGLSSFTSSSSSSLASCYSFASFASCCSFACCPSFASWFSFTSCSCSCSQIYNILPIFEELKYKGAGGGFEITNHKPTTKASELTKLRMHSLAESAPGFVQSLAIIQAGSVSCHSSALQGDWAHARSPPPLPFAQRSRPRRCSNRADAPSAFSR